VKLGFEVGGEQGEAVIEPGLGRALQKFYAGGGIIIGKP